MKRLGSVGVAALTMMILVGSAGAQAESVRQLFGDGGGSGCYKRTYSKAHMAKHPNQMVSMIELAYAPATDPNAIASSGPISFGLSVRTRRPKDGLVGNVALCREEAGKVACGLEGDGGSFTLTGQGNGQVKLSVTVDMAFESDRFIALGSDDKVFVLDKTSARNCQKP